MYDTQRPYTASFLIIRNDKNQIAFLLRSNTSWMNGHYGLPSGKVEKGESFSAAAVREAEEEVGIKVKTENLKPAITTHRYSQEENKDIDDMQWVDLYFEVIDYEGELRNAEPHMHSELAWLSLDNLPKNITPSVAESLKAWSEGKRYFEYGY